MDVTEALPDAVPAQGQGAHVELAGDVAGAAVAAAPAAAAEAQQGEPMRRHRRRLAAAVKVGVVMVLLEVRVGWFLMYFFACFLFIGGLFDPLLDWFRRHSAQATLEQQLNMLRNRP